MVYFCADDYGISAESNRRIENCIKNGILNKVSVLPNGEIVDFKERLSGLSAELSLHMNLVEGYPLSNPEDVGLLISKDGRFKYSFAGLFFLAFSGRRKEAEKQIYKEIQSQIKFWKESVGENNVVSIDSHQHTHMIPLVFKTLMRVIKDEGLNVKCVRVPAEPILPYILTPSLYSSYTLTGAVKQWVLKTLAFINRRELKISKIESAYFMGAMFSGKLNEKRLKKLLPKYLKHAEKNGKDIEIGFHPGYLKTGENTLGGSRESFGKFYYSHWREIEYNTLMNFEFGIKDVKEGYENAVH